MRIRYLKNVLTTVLVVVTTLSVGTTSVMGAQGGKEVVRMGTDNFCVAMKDAKVSSFAMKEKVKVNEKILNDDGCVEKVVRVNLDGSFVTEEISNRVVFVKGATRCSHPVRSLTAIANLGNAIDYVGDPDLCYRERPVIKNRCNKCNNTSIITYGAWKKHKKHSYPLFKKTCKRCGYRKK